MNKQEKNEVIEVLKQKFTQYSNFYITDTESLSVAQVTNLRRACFDKNVEMRVAKNTLIRKALESLDATSNSHKKHCEHSEMTAHGCKFSAITSAPISNVFRAIRTAIEAEKRRIM